MSRGRISLLVLKHIFDPDMAEWLPEIFNLLKELADQKILSRYFQSLIHYLMNALDGVSIDDISSAVSHSLPEEKGEYIMNLAERKIKSAHSLDELSGFVGN